MGPRAMSSGLDLKELVIIRVQAHAAGYAPGMFGVLTAARAPAPPF